MIAFAELNWWRIHRFARNVFYIFQIDLKAFLASNAITALLAFNLVKKINSLKSEYNKLSVSNLSQFMKRNQLSIDKHQNERGLQIFNNFFSENAFPSHWITWRQFTAKKQVFVVTTQNFDLYNFFRTGSTKLKNLMAKSASKYSSYSCINRCLSVQMFSFLDSLQFQHPIFILLHFSLFTRHFVFTWSFVSQRIDTFLFFSLVSGCVHLCLLTHDLPLQSHRSASRPSICTVRDDRCRVYCSILGDGEDLNQICSWVNMNTEKNCNFIILN